MDGSDISDSGSANKNCNSQRPDMRNASAFDEPYEILFLLALHVIWFRMFPGSLAMKMAKGCLSALEAAG